MLVEAKHGVDGILIMCVHSPSHDEAGIMPEPQLTLETESLYNIM